MLERTTQTIHTIHHPGAPLRASLYVRLSRIANEANLSLEGMQTDLRDLCTRLGFVEVAMHIDNGKSGAIRNRPKFRAWLADARNGTADVLMAWDVSRMTREGINVAAHILDTIEGKHPETGRLVSPPVRLIDFKGLDSADGLSFRINFLIRAEAARDEREQIRTRSRSRDRRLRLIPERFPGGIPPYGYRIIPLPGWEPDPNQLRQTVPTTLTTVPEEAAALHEAARQLLAGIRRARVCLWLNDNAPPPRRSKYGVWTIQSMVTVLTGTAVLGYKAIDGDVLRDGDGKPIECFPPIFTPAMSAALKAVLSPQVQAASGTPARPATRLLAGMLYCHSCRRLMGPNRRPEYRGRPSYVVYACQSVRHGVPCEKPVTIDARHSENFVTGVYLDRYGRLPHTERRLIITGDTRREAIESAIAATGARVARNARDTEALDTLVKLQDELAALNAEGIPVPRMEDVPTGRTKAEEWALQDIPGRRDMLAVDWPEKIVVGPHVTIARNKFDTNRLRLNLTDHRLYPAPLPDAG